MKKNITKTSFNAGQISEELIARVDVNKYDNGFSDGLNLEISSRGPVSNRKGFKQVAPVKDSTKTVYFIEFDFSQNDSYLIECGVGYFRFIREGLPVTVEGTTITAITKANPGQITSNSHGLANNTQIYLKDILGMTELNNRKYPFVVSSTATNTFSLKNYFGDDVDTTGLTTYTSGGKIHTIYEVANDYATEAELRQISYRQFGDLIYIAHPNHPPHILTRFDDADWTFKEDVLSPPPSYVAGYEPDLTLTPSATTGSSINFTASSALWLQGDVGRQLINNTDGETGRAVITSITSTTVAVADILDDFTDTNAIASGDWVIDSSPIAEISFSDTVAGSTVNVTANYPTGYKLSKVTVTNITKANPAVVTTSTSHGYPAGAKVYLAQVVGMTEINERTLTATAVTSNTLTLSDGNGTAFNASGYTAYASGGYVQRVMTEVQSDCFRTADIGKYIIANDGVIQIKSIVSAREIKGVILKSLSSKNYTNNWSLEVPSWNSTRGYPRAVGFYNQRAVYAGTTAEPLEINFSEIGVFNGFGRGSGDSDAIQVKLPAEKVNQINWIANTKVLVIGTSGSEITIDAPSSGSGLSATNIRQDSRSKRGSETQIPVSVGTEILYIQRASRKINSFKFDYGIDSYDSEDLTYIADNLTEGGIKEMAYAQEPDNTIYCVTNNGEMIVCKYNQKQEVIGWSKWDTDGTIENVQVISEDDVDNVYICVKRGDYRYIEKLEQGTGEDYTDAFFDNSLVKDDPMTVASIAKSTTTVVTVTGHTLVNGDVVKFRNVEGMTDINNKTYLVSSVGSNVFTIKTLEDAAVNSTSYGTFTSGQVYKLTKEIIGLETLEGKTVTVKADNAVTGTYVVSNGSITLDEYLHSYVVGLAYSSYLELLEIHLDVGLGPTANINVRYIDPNFYLLKSYPPIVNGFQAQIRKPSDLMDVAVPLFTGAVKYGNMNWTKSGSMRIDFNSGLPCKILGIFGTVEVNT